MKTKPRVAWFSPLNIGPVPGPTTSAYVTDELSPLLSDEFEIDFYHDGFDQYRNAPTYHFLSAFSRHKEKPYDIFFYQLEDSRASYFSRAHLALVPGITLFHDFILSDDGPEPLLNSPWTEVVEKFKGGSERSWPDRKREYKKLSPMAYREVGLSGISVFSDERAHLEFRRNAKLKISDAQSYYLPFPVDSSVSRRPIRDAEEKVVIYAGTPRIESRAHKVLQALSEVTSPVKLRWLINESEREEAEKLLVEFGIFNSEFVLERSPAWWKVMTADADIAIHTYFSVYGQPGAYLAMSLMAGLPCIATRFGSTEYISDSLVFKTEAGDCEAKEIEEVLKGLLEGSFPTFPERVTEFAREQFDKKQVARELSQIFYRSIEALRPLNSKWSELESDARRALISENLSSIEDWGKPEIEKIFSELGWER